MAAASGVGSIIGAVGGVANTIGGTVYQAKQAQQQANKARNFQREVLQNSVRWKVADLRAAGLNPILAATGGGLGGSSAPGGVVAQVPNFGAIGSAGTEGYRAGAGAEKDTAEAGRAGNQSKAAQTQADLNTASIESVKAQAERNREGINTEKAHQNFFNMQAVAASASADQAAANTALLQARKPEAQRIADMWSDPYMGRIMQWRHLVAPSGFIAGGGAPPGQGGQKTTTPPASSGNTSGRSAGKAFGKRWGR